MLDRIRTNFELASRNWVCFRNELMNPVEKEECQTEKVPKLKVKSLMNKTSTVASKSGHSVSKVTTHGDNISHKKSHDEKHRPRDKK